MSTSICCVKFCTAGQQFPYEFVNLRINALLNPTTHLGSTGCWIQQRIYSEVDELIRKLLVLSKAIAMPPLHPHHHLSYTLQNKKVGFSKIDLKQNSIKIKMKLTQMMLLLELLLLLLPSVLLAFLW